MYLKIIFLDGDFKLGLEGWVRMLWKGKGFLGRVVLYMWEWRKWITGSRLLRWALEKGTGKNNWKHFKSFLENHSEECGLDNMSNSKLLRFTCF